MTVACPSCGQETPEGFPRCANCGAELSAVAPVAREERKVVTVLFCDLVGFTSRAESMDPEDVRALLSGYHELVKRELERHGGTVEKFVGDAVMALFGAPVAHEDDPERAVRAAFAVRDTAELDVRIGITTGEAHVVLAARPESGEAMASGDVVNTASRLQSAAAPNAILVDDGTYRATRQVIDYVAGEAVEARGKAEPVSVWEAVDARSRFGVDVLERPDRPLVGRERERGLLVDTLARVRAEREPQLVTLVGVPGIGKSRLVGELFAAVDEDPELMRWRQGRSLPYGDGVAFWALGEMVKAQAGILETDSADEAGEKLARAVRDVVTERADWVEEHLRPLVSLAAEARDDGGAEVFAAWRTFFEALAESGPLVLVFEDLQWADEGLLDFIDHLVDWTSGVPLLVVCTARPELLARRAGWGGGKPNAATISLPPLSEAETALLVHALLERPVLEAELQATLLRRAGGNPLYAEEFARMIEERGSLAKELPETVQGIIAARLDALSTDEKAVLQDAAVLGKVFWAGAVASLGGRDPHDVEGLLHGLERRELVRRERRSSVAGEHEYAFRHLLVGEVAYGQIPRRSRAEKHRLAAEWIEALGRPEDQAEMLAHHYLQAIEYSRATDQELAALVGPARSALVEAGARARALEAYPAAQRYYGAALDLDDEREPELLLDYAEARSYAERDADLSSILVEARDALVERGAVGRAAQAQVMLARTAWRRGGRQQADEGYRSAIAMLADEPPSRAKAQVFLTAARAQMLAGDGDAAIELASKALAIAEELDVAGVRAGALITLGECWMATGQPRGQAHLRRGLELAVELNSASALMGYQGLADNLIEDGMIEAGFEARASSRRLAEQLGVGMALRWLDAERTGELYLLGLWDEAEQLADEFVDQSESGQRHYLEGMCRQVRAGIRLARGELEPALEDAATSLELGREARDPQALFPALAFSSRVLLVAGRERDAVPLVDELVRYISGAESLPIAYVWLRSAAVSLRELGRGDELAAATAAVRKRTPWLEGATALAAGDAHEAAEIYERIDARPDEAFARLVAAESLMAEGRRADGEAELAKAMAFFRSVGASALIARAERLLAASA